MTNNYLFYSSTVGDGTTANPFHAAIAQYTNNYRANDGRVDIENPNPGIYSMLVEAQLTADALAAAKNDPRMIQVFAENMPAMEVPISILSFNDGLSSFALQMETRNFPAIFINPDITFREFYKMLLLEFRFRTLLGDFYFDDDPTVPVGKGLLSEIKEKLLTYGFNVNFLKGQITPNNIVGVIYGQRNNNENLKRIFQTHLDLPMLAAQ